MNTWKHVKLTYPRPSLAWSNAVGVKVWAGNHISHLLCKLPGFARIIGSTKAPRTSDLAGSGWQDPLIFVQFHQDDQGLSKTGICHRYIPHLSSRWRTAVFFFSIPSIAHRLITDEGETAKAARLQVRDVVGSSSLWEHSHQSPCTASSWGEWCSPTGKCSWRLQQTRHSPPSHTGLQHRFWGMKA